MKAVTKLSIWIIFILFLVIVLGRFNDNKPIRLVNPFLKPNLKMTVGNSLSNSEGRFGIFIKNLKTQEQYALNTNLQFEAGSLYKLWVMGAVFKKIQSGQLSEDKEIVGDIAKLNATFGIPTDDAELTEGSLDLTIKSALEQMITISHNYAAFMLTLEVGDQALEDFLKEYDLVDSSIGPPKTSASDIGKFYEKLYSGRLVDSDSSMKMLDILSKQQINDRIPKLLPEGTKVSHKTADTGFFEHDGGVVFTSKGDYIIVLLSETDSPPAATEEIAKISRAVYEYFTK